MKPNFLNNGFLRSAETGAPEGGGGAAQQTPEQQAAPAKKPGVVQLALAGLQDKATLNGRIKELEGQVSQLTSDNATLISENQRLTADAQEYAADMATLEAALDGQKQEVTSVGMKAAQIVKEKGFEANALPDPAPDAAVTRESLEAQIAVETDDQKKWDLIEQLGKLP